MPSTLWGFLVENPLCWNIFIPPSPRGSPSTTSGRRRAGAEKPKIFPTSRVEPSGNIGIRAWRSTANRYVVAFGGNPRSPESSGKGHPNFDTSTQGFLLSLTFRWGRVSLCPLGVAPPLGRAFPPGRAFFFRSLLRSEEHFSSLLTLRTRSYRTGWQNRRYCSFTKGLADRNDDVQVLRRSRRDEMGMCVCACLCWAQK